MKRLLPIGLLAVSIIVLSSCAKQVDIIVETSNDPLPGNWYISDASVYDGHTWSQFDYGLYGTFSFYSNGSATYNDGRSLLDGNWITNTSFDSYYDYNGNYRTDRHETFSFYADDPAGHSVHLSFDDIAFTSSTQFMATYDDGSLLQAYTFSRGN